MHLTFALITVSSTLVFSDFQDLTVLCTSGNLVCLYNTPSHLSMCIYVIALSAAPYVAYTQYTIIIVAV